MFSTYYILDNEFDEFNNIKEAIKMNIFKVEING